MLKIKKICNWNIFFIIGKCDDLFNIKNLMNIINKWYMLYKIISEILKNWSEIKIPIPIFQTLKYGHESKFIYKLYYIIWIKIILFLILFKQAFIISTNSTA